MNNYDDLIPMNRLDIIKNHNKKLLSTRLVPSTSHSYALAVEYIKKWFLSKFSKDFFNTIYVEGKNIFDESRRFNIDSTANRSNPAVSFIPSIDYSFDRDKIDLAMGGLEIYEQKSTMDTCFFRDYENGLYIKLIDQLNVINFTIRVYLDTKAKQLNVWHYMKLAFRVGASQGEYVDMDFSIPEELMIQLAKHTGFEVDEENKKIKNVVEFLAYLNKNSLCPFLYKLRCENGRDEFFIRISGQYVHINIPDALSVEDGDRVGHVYENFPIEMNLELRFPSPQSFVYLSKSPQTIIEGIKMEECEDITGLYSIKVFDIPPVNDKKWGIYIESEYLEDKPICNIKVDFTNLCTVSLTEIIDYTKKQYISPALFLDVKLFSDNGELIKTKVDWNTLTVESIDDKRYQKVIIAIYADNKYMNETIVTMNNSNNTRLNRSNTQ